MLLAWDPRDRMLRDRRKCREHWACLGRKKGYSRRAVAKREAPGEAPRRLEKAAFTKTKNKNQNH